ncbi:MULTISPECIES: type IV pilus inner membrane component PilO [Thiorhodovibrio]|uniref:type 4a pilus biogenesis protein PilO n=1 Tax=Thiorhodovibrio TaxID=61593 RepID=UPI001911E6EA|nr:MULTISPECIES: type 4a pilus biogenesis protein PilO [Thiorhodovibrio]MBK5967854.1 pilus assembly protein PilO [Thiorhodovibrio winogradskyi]WPL14079.1 Pilus assembly protein, PilO [Thiorhodovibrio litoralis]
MDLNQLNELDFNNLGEAPVPVKAVIILLLCAAVGYGWYHFSTSKQIEQLKTAERKETELKQTFETKQKKAANLDAYKQQLADMDESFGAMLKRLPNQTEVDDLLIDVSQTGLASGLEFELFQPTGEQARDFYAEYPIKVRVTGQYHQFGEFVSGLAALPRIVTIHNIAIQGDNGGGRGRGAAAGPGDSLTLDATVKTYRYLEENTLQ